MKRPLPITPDIEKLWAIARRDAYQYFISAGMDPDAMMSSFDECQRTLVYYSVDSSGNTLLNYFTERIDGTLYLYLADMFDGQDQLYVLS